MARASATPLKRQSLAGVMVAAEIAQCEILPEAQRRVGTSQTTIWSLGKATVFFNEKKRRKNLQNRKFFCIFAKEIKTNLKTMKSMINNLLRNLNLFVASIFLSAVLPVAAADIVILHTNDTHSHIDAENGIGGVLQRKALIDSVRKAEKNVLLVDAGDVVQGSLYFKLFGGDVEFPLMNMMGYDIQILGNHEFDNGIDELARHYKTLKATKLAANYNFDNTRLKGLFLPTAVKKIGGKKIGFIGLNVDPEGIISRENNEGIIYEDVIEAANREAARLRQKDKCDYVVAVTHIGYNDQPAPNDVALAEASRGIDVIVGGHSHTLIDPSKPAHLPNLVRNLDGKDVLIAQTGRYGANLGLIRIPDNGSVTSQLIPVKGVDERKFDRAIINFLKPYAAAVDSINHRPVAVAVRDMPNTKKYATSTALSNWTADFAQWYGSLVADSVAAAGGRLRSDMAIMNSGGVRLPVRKGIVSEGDVLSMFPFPNRMTIVEMNGSQLAKLIEQAVKQEGQAFSSGVKVACDDDGAVRSITLGGNQLVPDKSYYVTTIDYLAGGGDYLDLFPTGKRVWTDSKDMCAPVMRYVVHGSALGFPLDGSDESRIVKAVVLP